MRRVYHIGSKTYRVGLKLWDTTTYRVGKNVTATFDKCGQYFKVELHSSGNGTIWPDWVERAKQKKRGYSFDSRDRWDDIPSEERLRI